MLPFLRQYVEGVKTNPPASRNYSKVKGFLVDKLLQAKLGFLQSIALELEVYLTRYQTNNPMLPFLYGDLCTLLRNLLNRFVKRSVMEQTNNRKLHAINVTKSENLEVFEKIEIGFPAQAACKGLGKADILSFRKECREFLQFLINKLLEKSPLKYRLVVGATCIDPDIMLNQTLRNKRVSEALEDFINHNRISTATADLVKREYLSLCESKKVQEQLRMFDRRKERLDHLLYKILEEESCSSDLLNFVKRILILFHGNAAVERGFSINKEILVDNLQQHSLIAQRAVYDAITNDGGVETVVIDKRMIQAARNASARRVEALKAKQNAQVEAEKRRKRAAEELKELNEKKRKLKDQRNEEDDAIDEQIKKIKETMIKS